jgi:glycosyltransferase involved in cell wall biosynthesis
LVHTEHGRSDFARWKTKWAGKLAGSFVKRFYCLSKEMAEWVTSHHVVPRSKIRVIHNGIDTSCFRHGSNAAGLRHALGIADGAPVIGTVGRLSEVKRQDLLLRAFAQVHRFAPNAHLLLVGDGPRLGELRQLAATLGLVSCVHFAGYQSATASYYHAMQVFVLTSRSEGTPQALLEACVAGVPVVASRVGGIPEVIDHERTGILFDSGDEAALTTALVRLLREPVWGRELAAAAQARVIATYDIGSMFTKYHRDFEELLQPARPRLNWAAQP